MREELKHPSAPLVAYRETPTGRINLEIAVYADGTIKAFRVNQKVVSWVCPEGAEYFLKCNRALAKHRV